MNDKDYINMAKSATKNSHSPYSNYKVGCALVTKEGKVYTGCNIENHGIMSICSERVAFTKAISEGEKEFSKIYVVATKDGINFETSMPCGYCRQFMSEFVNKDFKIFVLENDNIKEYSIDEILPYSFEL